MLLKIANIFASLLGLFLAMNLSFWHGKFFSKSQQVLSGFQTGRLLTVNLFFGLVGPGYTRIYLFRLTKIMLLSFFFEKFRFFCTQKLLKLQKLPKMHVCIYFNLTKSKCRNKIEHLNCFYDYYHGFRNVSLTQTQHRLNMDSTNNLKFLVVPIKKLKFLKILKS